MSEKPSFNAATCSIQKSARRFNELRNRLAAKRLTGTRDDLIWSAQPERQP